MRRARSGCCARVVNLRKPAFLSLYFLIYPGEIRGMEFFEIFFDFAVARATIHEPRIITIGQLRGFAQLAIKRWKVSGQVSPSDSQ